MSRRGRGRGRIGTEVSHLAINRLLAASLVDEASLIAHITLLDPSQMSAMLSDDGGISLANLSLFETETVDTPGANSYIVPVYGILEIEGWGGGSGSNGADTNLGVVNRYNGTNGGDTSITIGALTLHANGGTRGDLVHAAGAFASIGTAPGVGGTASGGDTNINGNNGLNGSGAIDSSGVGGAGAGAPHGGGNVAGGADTNNLGVTGSVGNPGSVPGGGASGAGAFNASSEFWVAGAASGGYTRKIFVYGITPGYPEPGDTITYTNGAKGTGGTHAQTLNPMDGADGANGRVKFTVYADIPDPLELAASLSDQDGISEATFGLTETGSGAFDYLVPDYDNTLTMTLWGSGASGQNLFTQASVAGNATTASWDGDTFTANGGNATGVGQNNPGTGGTASGGDTNTTGGSGSAGGSGAPSFTGGKGGDAPGGGLGGLERTETALGNYNGNPGNAPGGGGGGARSRFNSGDTIAFAAAGGGAGGRLIKTWNRSDPDAPQPGDHITGTVGAGAVANAGGSAIGGDGANGGYRFTLT